MGICKQNVKPDKIKCKNMHKYNSTGNHTQIGPVAFPWTGMDEHRGSLTTLPGRGASLTTWLGPAIFSMPFKNAILIGDIELWG